MYNPADRANGTGRFGARPAAHQHNVAAEFMDIDTLVAAVSKSSLTSTELRGTADVLGCTVEELSDMVAGEVAQRFLDGRIPWELGDAAMNQLYALAYGNDELSLGDLACSVYLAFDEGEYVHGEDPELDGEPRTRKILTSMMTGG